MSDNRNFTASLRKLFLEYLSKIEDWSTMEISDENWSNLLIGLKHVAQQEYDYTQSNLSIQIFSQIINQRPNDKLKIVNILND